MLTRSVSVPNKTDEDRTKQTFFIRGEVSYFFIIAIFDMKHFRALLNVSKKAYLITNGFLHGSQMNRDVRSIGNQTSVGTEQSARKIQPFFDVGRNGCPLKNPVEKIRKQIRRRSWCFYFHFTRLPICSAMLMNLWENMLSCIVSNSTPTFRERERPTEIFTFPVRVKLALQLGSTRTVDKSFIIIAGPLIMWPYFKFFSK